MRRGTPFNGFERRGLTYMSLGRNGIPLYLLLYDSDDVLIAKLKEIQAPEHQEGNLFSSASDPAASQLVEYLRDGSNNVVHDSPRELAANLAAWRSFLDNWIRRHEQAISRARTRTTGAPPRHERQ